MTDFRKAIDNYLGQHGFERFCPKAVLFDMDGVIYDSMPFHGIAWNRSMAEYGIHMTVADSYATEGARGYDTIRRFAKEQLGKDLTEDEAKVIYAEKARIFHSLGEAPVFPGVKRLMQEIVASELSVNVVTGSAQQALIDKLQDDFKDFLTHDHITTAFDIKHGKPAPDPYLAGLRKAGNLHPWEAIVVENAPLGVRSGVAAQIFTVAINSGPLPDSALSDEGCSLLYKHIADFADDWHDFYNAVKQ